MTPEFSRLYPLDTIGSAPRKVEITASAEECASLARRFDLVSIDTLTAQATLVQTALGFTATGKVSAILTQSCVATASPVVETIAEAFSIRFIAEGEINQGDEIELDADDCDVMFHDGRALDLGEAVAQSVALALNPFPRAADAEGVLRKAGVVPEGEEARGPFAGLKGLLSPPP
jgi:uncharacterized metal-binding protein YceD (DUF177 family)